MEDPYDAVRYIAHRALGILGKDGTGYDFVGPPAIRTAAVREIKERWKSSPHPTPPPAVLIDQNGEVKQAEFERLLRRRNQRELILDE
jgi:hypothetical protein